LTLRPPARRDDRSAMSPVRSLPQIDVEQRPLRAYAALAGGAR
jgi:hypothetical protein